MILRALPALLAVAALADAASTTQRVAFGMEAFARLRHAVRVDPTAARADFCAAKPERDVCLLDLVRGGEGDGGPACPASWAPGPPRYYTVRLRCRLPPWLGGLALPLLEARLFR